MLLCCHLHNLVQLYGVVLKVTCIAPKNIKCLNNKLLYIILTSIPWLQKLETEAELPLLLRVVSQKLVFYVCTYFLPSSFLSATIQYTNYVATWNTAGHSKTVNHKHPQSYHETHAKNTKRYRTCSDKHLRQLEQHFFNMLIQISDKAS